jgi:hypothetical protein
MPLKNVVFILGAGSNQNYGFFSGEGLKNYCCYEFKKRLDKFPNIDNPPGILKKDAEILSEIANTRSHDNIDQILSMNADLELVGKFAIVDAILHCERHSYPFAQLNLYISLFRFIRKGINHPNEFEQIFENDFTFITFNYDRSLEYYFYNALHNFKRNLQNLSDIYRRVFKIYHFYGTLGSILKGEANYLEFGSNPDPFKLIDASSSIEVLHNDKLPSNFIAIQDALKKANIVFFLGFGFDDENLRKLRIPETLSHDCNVYGTGINIGRKAQRLNELFKKFRFAQNHENIINKDAETFTDTVIQQYIETGTINNETLLALASN